MPANFVTVGPENFSLSQGGDVLDRRSGLATCLLALSVTWILCGGLACGGGTSGEEAGPNREDGGSCSTRLTGWTPASEWVRKTTGIAGYRYDTAPGETEIPFELVDASGASLGTMRVDQVGEEGEAPAGAMRAILESEGAPNVELTTTGRERAADYTVRMRLRRGDRQMRIWADFGLSRCGSSSTGEKGPSCASTLPVGETPYLLPSCGLGADDRRLAGLEPRLLHLEYGVAAGQMDSAPAGGGYFRRGEVDARTRTVVSEETAVDADTVDTWLETTGLAPLVSSSGSRRLAAAYLDQPWRGEVRSRRRACRSNGTASGGSDEETTEQALPCRRSGLGPVDHRTRRQAQSGCGDGGYDEGAWGGAGGDSATGGSDSCSGGCAMGDPHLTTFDGHAYDFQGAGEYVLVETTGETPFVVQARMEPGRYDSGIPACKDVSVVTAVAATFGDGTISMYRDRQPRLYVDGQPVEEPGEVSDWPEGVVLRQPDDGSYLVQWSDGRRLEVDVDGNALGVDIDLPEKWRGQVRGLLGTFDGSIASDFRTRGGRTLEPPVSFDERYRVFGASWRIETDDSLFNYGSGNDASTYHVPNFPNAPVELGELPADKRKEARETCEERAVREGTPMQWCLVDVVCSGNGDMADGHAEVGQPAATSHQEVTTTGDVELQEERSDVASAEPRPPRGTCGESSPRIALVPEQKAVNLSEPVGIDAAPGATLEATGDVSESEISPGDPVDGYLLHLEPTSGEDGRYEGSVQFQRDVLGVAVTGASLEDGDGLIGGSSNDYPTGASGRGPDWSQGDRITVEQKAVGVSLTAAENLDHVRILVRGSSS